jgi:hypothetical protein
VGVKTYYLFTSNDVTLVDMQAFFHLKEMHRKLVARGTKPMDFKGGWRKNIEPLFAYLKAWLGGVGHLSKLKTANPLKDKYYRAYRAKAELKKKIGLQKKRLLDPMEDFEA